MAQQNRLRWGVLGTARIADSIVQAIKSSSNCELVAVASRDAGQARAWAEERGVPLHFGSYNELLACGEIDAVYTPLPNALHKEWAIKATRLGKHVLCEKPLATSAHDAGEMAAAAEENGVRLMEAFMYRFHPQTALIKGIVAEGKIGDLKRIHANFGFWLARPEDVRWSSALGGGALLDVGCYCVNIVRLLVGAEPAVVVARAVRASTGVDETFAGLLEFENGVLASIGCSMQTGPGMDQSLIVSGTKGRITVSYPFRMDHEPQSVLVDNLDKEGHGETVEAPGADEYRCMVEHFADAVLNGTPLDYTTENSVNNMRVLDALAESARTGRTVTV